MVCVFPFVLPPHSPRGCGGWEPTCWCSFPLQGLGCGSVPVVLPCGAGSLGSASSAPCLLCPHKQLHFRLNHMAVLSVVTVHPPLCQALLTPCSLHCFFVQFLAWFCCSWESQNPFNLWSLGCRTRL